MTDLENINLENNIETAHKEEFSVNTDENAVFIENEKTVTEHYNKLVELHDEMTQSLANLEKVLVSSKELLNALKASNNALFEELITSLNTQIEEYSTQQSRLHDKKLSLEHVITCYDSVPNYADAVEDLSFIFGLLK